MVYSMLDLSLFGLLREFVGLGKRGELGVGLCGLCEGIG